MPVPVYAVRQHVEVEFPRPQMNTMNQFTVRSALAMGIGFRSAREINFNRCGATKHRKVSNLARN